MSAAPTYGPLRRLWRYASRFRKQIALASTFSILNTTFDLAPPVLIGAAVDVVVQRENSFLAGFGIPDTRTQLIVLAGLTFLIWLLESLFEYLHSIYWRNLAQSIEHELRIDAYRHVQSLELAYFEDRSTGGLMAVLNDDVNQLERFLDAGANDILHVGTTLVLIGAHLLRPRSDGGLDRRSSRFPSSCGDLFRFQRSIAPRYAAVRDQAGMVNSQLSNNLAGIATIKSFTAEDREVERISR